MVGWVGRRVGRCLEFGDGVVDRVLVGVVVEARRLGAEGPDEVAEEILRRPATPALSRRGRYLAR